MARGTIDPATQPVILAASQAAESVALDLVRLRVSRGVTQAALASALGIAQGGVSRLERRNDLLLSTLREYVEALGGRLELHAVFPDQTVEIIRPPSPDG